MRVGMAVPQEGLALALAAAFGLGGAAARFAVLAKTLRRLSKVKDVRVRELKTEGSPMNFRGALTGMVVVLAVTSLFAEPAFATRIPIKGHSQSQVKSACGGIFLPKNKQGTYGCVNDDGSGIICGGVKPVHQRTCDTFRVSGRDRGRLGDRLGR
jgi:hypothetical protein